MTKTIPIRVSAEQAREILSAFKINRKQAVSYKRDGVVPDSTEHYLFKHEDSSPIRHGVIGAYHNSNYEGTNPGFRNWIAAYISVSEDEPAFEDYESLCCCGVFANFRGPAGVMQRLPKRLLDIEDSILSPNRFYIGFAWMGLNPQPSRKDVEAGLESVVFAIEGMRDHDVR